MIYFVGWQIVSSFKNSVNVDCAVLKEYLGHNDGVWDVSFAHHGQPLIATASAGKDIAGRLSGLSTYNMWHALLIWEIVCFALFLFVCLSGCLSICALVCWSSILSVCLFVVLCLSLFIFSCFLVVVLFSVFLCYVFMHLSLIVCQLDSLFVCLLVYLFVCLVVCLCW